MTHDSIILITGGHGLLGRAISEALHKQGFIHQLLPTRVQLDFRDASATQDFFERERPQVVFHLASVVFGLLGNMTHQVKAISESTLINHNVIMAAVQFKVKKIFFAGSVASYPFPYKKLPLTEDMFWDGSPHPGELGYAHAKRHALAYLEIIREHTQLDFLYGVLTNLYGPEDRFDEQSGHVIPSLIRRLHRVRQLNSEFTVWGDGTARRDFMHVADAAEAVISGINRLSGIVNVSSGETVSIKDVVDALVTAADYKKPVVWQSDKPVGVPERSVSNSIIQSTGFSCEYSISRGVRETWDWFKLNAESARQ